MSAVVERLRAARASGDWTPLVEILPYARFLGLGCRSDGGEIVTSMSFAQHLIGNPVLPALHGGSIGALLESAAIFQLLAEAQSAILPKTITITIDYLRPARPADTHARGTITRLGKRVATVRVEAWQDDRDRPVATANVHLLLGPPV